MSNLLKLLSFSVREARQPPTGRADQTAIIGIMSVGKRSYVKPPRETADPPLRPGLALQAPPPPMCHRSYPYCPGRAPYSLRHAVAASHRLLRPSQLRSYSTLLWDPDVAAATSLTPPRAGS